MSNTEPSEKISIETLYGIIQNTNVLKKTQTKMLDEMLKYSKDNNFENTINRNFEFLTNIINQISTSKLDSKLKDFTTSLITSFIYLGTTSEIKDKLILELSNNLNNLSINFNDLSNEFQSERNEHNLLRKKYKENLKPMSIDFIPKMTTSITLKDNTKHLDIGEIIEIQNNVRNKIMLLSNDVSTKFKRLAVKNSNLDDKTKNKIKTMYSKPTNIDSIIQK